MKRSRLQETSIEVTVGAFMFMVLLALGFFTIVLSRENLFSPNYHLEVVFKSVQGLREGDNVFLRGVDVGKIKRLQLEKDGVHVHVILDIEPELHEDYRIEVLPSSVLGGRYLNIYEGSESKPLLPRDARLVGIPPVDLIEEATKTIQNIRGALEEGDVLNNLKSMMADLREITRKLNQGEGTLGKLLTDDEVYNELKTIAGNLRDVSDRLAQGKGTLGKLLSEDDQLHKDLSEIAANLKQITGDIEAGKGTIGKLVKDDALYQDAVMTINEVRAAVDDFRETTPISMFSSIFFGAF